MLYFMFCLFFAFFCVIFNVGDNMIIDDFMTIGDRIKKARKNAGLTQKELGERLGVSAAMVSQYETGSRTPRIDTMKRISTALNVPIQDLLNANYTGDVIKSAIPIAQEFKQTISNLNPDDPIPDDVRSQINEFTDTMEGLFLHLDSDKYMRELFEHQYIAFLDRLNVYGILVSIKFISDLIKNPKFTTSHTPKQE